MNLQEQISRIQSMMGVNESFLDWFKSPNGNNDKSEEERFTCADCGEKDYNMYMVNDDIWSEYGNDKFHILYVYNVGLSHIERVFSLTVTVISYQ